jgi:anti-sigma factor RsiW
MTTQEPLVEDAELHAFVDGQLDPDRLPAVLRHLQGNPDAAQRVAEWQAQKILLRRLQRQVEPGPAPAALSRTVMRAAHRERRQDWDRPWVRAAAALILLAAGAAGGATWSHLSRPTFTAAAGAPGFVRDAAVAYAVYTPEVRHPVEVPAAEEQHLVQWLSRRLGKPLVVPTLQELGYRLLGGRLLPGDPTPRAQFMYENAQGQRVTLYIAVFKSGPAATQTAFRSVREGNSESFYWMESGYGYALSGDLPAAQLQALASDVYDQLYPH